MASITPAPNASSTGTTSVDASLWWDPFSQLLTELENASLSSDDLPISLVKKLKDNHVWLSETVSQFKPPNQKSKDALNSQEVKIGSHQFTVQPDLKTTALNISSTLCLDEVQSYILVKRSIEHNAVALDTVVHEPLHLVMFQYYVERQCLLKCVRQILIHTLYAGAESNEGRVIREEALKLVSDGLESRLLSLLQVLLSSSYPEHMDIDLFTLWAEEILIEDNLILDILFLTYYESLCTCDGKQWKKLCLLYEGMVSGSCNFGKLAISSEAVQSIFQAKVQLLLILIETLDLENLLQMVHDEMPFRQGTVSFGIKDIQDIDAVISGLDALEMKEAGPLILTWAVFLCLISSLPKDEEHNVLMEIDHVAYVHHAIRAASLNYFLEILQSNILKDSDGPIAGNRSVLRTFISAFIASYEISLQLEDNNLTLILDILSEIYRGEESLCIQFWDKDSFIDGPVRCLLCNLEGEFPYRTVELVRLLSALSEGSWPAACVYNFLDKSVGLSTLLEITGNSMVDNESRIVETQLPLRVPGLEVLLIPSNTRGHVLKVIDASTALVRWEHTQSGVLVLLLRLAQERYPDGSEEVLASLDLLDRLVSFNEAVCYFLIDFGTTIQGKESHMNGHIEKVDVVEIICNLIKNLSPSCNGSLMMSMGVNILAMMLKCSPSHVTSLVLKTNIFDVALRMNPLGSDHLSSGSWLLSGRLAKMILIDSEHNDGSCPLAVSVLEFTIQLVETGVQNDFVLALVVFSIQYVLVNHEFWKFKTRHLRWKVTLKVLEVIKKCLSCIPYSKKLEEVVRQMLLGDSSIHSAIFRIVCTTTPALERLYVSRLYDSMEIEGVQVAVSSVLDILSNMLSELSKDNLPSVSVFHQAVLSSTTKPIPVFTALTSLISCFRNPNIQAGAARVLSMLIFTADYLQLFSSGIACFALDDREITDLKTSVNAIIREQAPLNDDLIINTFKMLASAATFQPAFLLTVIGAKDNIRDISFGSLGSKEENLLDGVREYVAKSAELVKSDPNILLNVLNFLKALWQGAPQFANILEWLKKSENFWTQLSQVLMNGSMQDNSSGALSKRDSSSSACRYQCQSSVLQIMAYEIFLQKKVLHAEVQANQTSVTTKEGKSKDASVCGPKDILSTWCGNSLFSNLIKSYVTFEYDCDKYLKAKVAAALFCVHVMVKLRSNDMGSLSVSLIEKISILSQKLSDLPAFSELSSQYKQRGYSDEKKSNGLVISDLYYHLQGEFEGRKIDNRTFKELFQFLLESKFLEGYQLKHEGDLSLYAEDFSLFDINRLRADLGIDMWDFSEWKASKPVAEAMLLYLQDVNSMLLLTNSKISALKALVTILPVYDEDVVERKATIGQKLPEQQIFSCIDHVCQSVHATLESLQPVSDSSTSILDFLAAQAEFLLHFIRSVDNRLLLPASILILKTSGAALKVLSDFRPSVSTVKSTMKLFLMVLLSSVEFSCINALAVGATEPAFLETYGEISTISLGLFPVLCNCIEPADLCTLSLTSIDLLLKGFLAPTTWFPIIQKHLHLHLVIKKLQDKSSLASVSVILKFFLTLARVKGGAEMLVNAGFFDSLRILFSPDVGPLSVLQGEKNLPVSHLSEKGEKPQYIWGLGLAVVTAIIQSLADNSSSSDLVDYVISYLFLEKSHLVSYYLNTLDFSFNANDKKRARTQRMPTSLNVLKETQYTLILICVLAKHQNSWNKAIKDMDVQLRERSIHLLAFISRGTQLLGESGRAPPIQCHPILKEEFEWYKKPSFVKSKNGWFSLSPLGCGLDPRFSTLSSKANAQASENNDAVPQTCFSDITAIEIYRIAFYLLNFLCLQADAASRRAEEVGFIDAAHFPELPMPDILHGLQDQGIAIVHELCVANNLKQVPSEVRAVCILLLHITEMALYLEFCVSQICGIRPVMGRVEDFSKEIKLLLRATEGHAFLKEQIKRLKQITSFVYPGLLQTEGFL